MSRPAGSPGVITRMRTETAAMAIAVPPITITDQDFTAHFDGAAWVVKWMWKDGPPELRNSIGCYTSPAKPRIREKFDMETEHWIAEGWLRPWSGVAGGVIPLLAVEQQSQDKVHPVIDYRELNQFVECHTGCDVTVCDETIRKLRRSPGPQKLVDLRSAYLQIHVDESLWPYQQVHYKGRLHCLTRLGFSLNCAPWIITRISYWRFLLRIPTYSVELITTLMTSLLMRVLSQQKRLPLTWGNMG